MPQRNGNVAHGQQTGQGAEAGAGVLERAAESTPVVGTPVRLWQTAREGTETVASTLPDCCGMDQVKQFIHRHPVLSTLVVLGLGYLLVGGTLAGRRDS
jgi:hypothetical protein